MSPQSTKSSSDQPQTNAHGHYRVDPLAPAQGSREWVVPNGLGGFAMGTVSSTPDRRYHSILTASLHPPVMRMNLVATIDEQVIVESPEGPLAYHLTPIRFVDSKPSESFCTRFEKTPTGCVWCFELPLPQGTAVVRKELQVADGVSASRVSYTIESDQPCRLEIRPLLAMRDFHAMNTPGTIQASDLDVASIKDATRIARGELAMAIRSTGCSPSSEDSIWNTISYAHEQDRGLEFVEDLYCPLVFATQTQCTIEFALDTTAEIDWDANRAKKSDRITKMVSAALVNAGNPSDPRIRTSIERLAVASDDFIVRRDHDGLHATSIIAGYPWFSDWGRDSMIALPGLLLVTGRHEEAFEVLCTFASAQHKGLIPNRFDDREGEAHYNTVDASLWFIHACVQYAQVANDRAGFDEHLCEPCIAVIEAYRDSTSYNIAVDPADGLVAAGNAHTQLTWMDAQRNGITFTPRHGKPIEINALWINALTQLATMLETSDPQRAHNYFMYADGARRSLLATMTGGPGGLVDCLTPTNHARGISWKRSGEIRPNQAFAVSLPGVGLAEHIALGAVDAVNAHLLTAVGLRTLSATDQAYCAHYVGPLLERDRAYHNGTVWPWLLGSLCEADMRVHGFDKPSRQRTVDRVCAIADELCSGSVGSITEIYDAEPGADGKHTRQGCPAQAWSVSELLRVLVLAQRD